MNRTRAGLLALAAFGLVLPPPAPAQIAPAPLPAALSPLRIPQFVQALPTLGNLGIPVVTSTAPVIHMCEYQQSILPPGSWLGVGKTWVWGYKAGSCAQNVGSYIGPVIVATRGVPTQVTFQNNLGDTSTTKVLAYKQGTDQTLMWADPRGTSDVATTGVAEANFCYEWVAANPDAVPPGFCSTHYLGPIAAAPHLHGGEIPAALDGGPDAWWTGTGLKGHGYYSKAGAAASQAIYTYPNGQEAAPIWFHDHTLGATRLNVYAGIAGAYMIIDPARTPPGMTALGLPNGTNGLVPSMGELLVPVVIQDRTFDVNGQLLFPNVGINVDHPFWIPEFVGDTIVVNGKVWPFLDVEPKRYRFLFLNGSNARAYELFLVDKFTGASGPPLWVIGTDQGYLDKPAKVGPAAGAGGKLVMMPGERYEVIVDFTGLKKGTRLLLSNTAPAPYPAGIPPTARTTGRIMEIRVGACTSGLCGAADPSYNPAGLATIRVANPIQRLADPATGAPALTAPGGPPITIHKVRRLTLNEYIGVGGPLEVLVNNTRYAGAARGDFTPITTAWNTTHYSELPNEGETELWEIVNLTADAHPIHPHLVGFQLMNRQAFDLAAYDAAYSGSFPGMAYVPSLGPPLDYNCGGPAPGRGVVDPALGGCVFGGNPDVTPYLVGAAIPPTPAEAGWKDTVVVYPGQVTRFLVRFAPTPLANSTPADAAHYEFDPNGGHGFVWHCHIIDHEDNEMMRPFSVLSNPAAARTFIKGISF